MRVFEDLVPIERASGQPGASGGDDQFHGETSWARKRETNSSNRGVGG
jgi:hypothetical protein